MAVISIPKVLRDKIGEEATDALTEVIKSIDTEARKEALALAEERLERRLTEENGKIRLEIEKVRTEMQGIRMEMQEVRTEIGQLRTEIKEEIGKLNEKIASTKSEMIKWVFIFWIGQTGAIMGILFAFFK